MIAPAVRCDHIEFCPDRECVFPAAFRAVALVEDDLVTFNVCWAHHPHAAVDPNVRELLPFS